MIEASLVWSNKSISSQIAHWTIVNYDSPVYRLCMALDYHAYSLHPKTEIKRSILVVLQSMLKLFKEGRARPRDLFPDGSTIFHVHTQILHCVKFINS
jgi:hypothetical protein